MEEGEETPDVAPTLPSGPIAPDEETAENGRYQADAEAEEANGDGCHEDSSDEENCCSDGNGWAGDDSRERHEPKGFLQTRYRVWREQYDFVRSLLSSALGADYSPGRHRFWSHVLASQLGDPWKWVPVYHALIEQLDDYLAEGADWPCSEQVWRGLADAGLLLVRGHSRHRGLSREFRIPDEVSELFLAHGAQTIEEASGPVVNLFSGRAANPVPTTKQHDENGNKHPELYREGMAELRYGRVNQQAVLRYLADAQADVDEAQAEWEDAGGERFAALEVREWMARHVARGGKEHDRRAADYLGAWEAEHGNPHTPEYLAYRKLRNGLVNDRSCWTGILAQHPEPTETPGISRYKLNYEFQASGRAGHVKGGAQSCRKEMKVAIYEGVPDVRNYDLVGSQPNFLIELFEEANEMGGGGLSERPLDAAWMECYVNDPDGKHRLAEQIGIEVGTWKSVLCALMMGATLPVNPADSKGDLVKTLREDPACQTVAEFRAVWERLCAEMRPFYGELRRWHEWLDEVFAPRRASGGNGNGGHYVLNAVGGKFYPKEHRKPHERQAKLAAFMLQGKERAFVLSLLRLAPKFGFEPISDEHDGLVVIGEIPEAAVEEAKQNSGVQRARLIEKPFSA